MHITSDSWRTFAGFLVGIVLTIAGIWLFFFTKWDASAALTWLTTVLAAPVMGFVQALSMTVPESVLGPLLPFALFVPYPVALAALFGLSGRRQTMKVMLWEAFVVLALVAFGAVGFRA